MGLAKIRKMVTIVEDTLEEGGQEILPPARRAAAIAVIEIDEVLEHSIVSTGVFADNSSKILYLSSTFSVAASITICAAF